jgi:uncharacterized protein (TIGR04255 family)
MTWNVAAQTHKVFRRNPLVAVIVELRFFPILKLADKVADFQDQIRGTFPAFQDVTRQLVDLEPSRPIGVRNERLFSFAKVDDSSTLSLSTSSLAVESRRHERRQHFINDAAAGINALSKVCEPVVPTRLGLRYVNIIDKEAIEQDLGRPTSWPQLISNRFLAVPTELADLNETLFACEVGSSMPNGGGQTVRFGLIQDADKRVKFRLDIDRYLDRPGEPSNLVGLLGTFSDDVFAVFVAAMGSDLKAWMPEGSA